VLTIKTIQAYYNGSVFVPSAPVKVMMNQPVLVTILELENMKTHGSHYENFFGALSYDDFLEISEALKDTERIDAFEW
jgi:hypothetical protein